MSTAKSGAAIVRVPPPSTSDVRTTAPVSVSIHSARHCPSEISSCKGAAGADHHNLYAYALRKGPSPDMDLVFKHYNEALRLDPRHRGAHEYIGEAYLTVGNVHKAREHLTALDRLCIFGCAEYTDLKKAIAAYEAKHRR